MLLIDKVYFPYDIPVAVNWNFFIFFFIKTIITPSFLIINVRLKFIYFYFLSAFLTIH